MYNVSTCENHLHDVETFLCAHADFLDNFVLKHCEEERIASWLERKRFHDSNKITLPPCFNRTEGRNAENAPYDELQSENFFPISTALHPSSKNFEQALFIYEIGKCFMCCTIGDEMNVYVTTDNGSYLSRVVCNQQKVKDFSLCGKFPIRAKEYLMQYAASVKKSLNIDLTNTYKEFPFGIHTSYPQAKYVLCIPVITSDDHLLGTVEIIRKEGRAPFHISCCTGCTQRTNESNLNEFLLKATKDIFKSMDNLDEVITKIMSFAKDLVGADRASLFLIDVGEKEIFAKIFNLGEHSYSIMHKTGSDTVGKYSQEIRFPIGKGFAGYVANTGEILNVIDAYKDERFNRDIDQMTGYKTTSMLCMPIYNEKRIIGVMQMINKRNGLHFTKDDEKEFEFFAIYCGLAIGHAQLYDEMRRSEQKLKVAMDTLTYHASCTAEEFQSFQNLAVPDNLDNITSLNFSPWDLSESEKVVYAFSMLNDTFGISGIDTNTLIKFILTVRKNYRKIPYHNWTHAFSVANSIYSFIKIAKSSSHLCMKENIALLVACLCHDLDHMGRTNSYMIEKGTTLGALYITSTMENHHFNRTVTILQNEECNIFKSFSSTEYKLLLDNIKHCIISTDLEVHFQHLHDFSEIIASGTFEWENEEHRKLVMSLLMTSADLSACYKPYEIQREVAFLVMEEFWQQGDEDRANGIRPQPIMDRSLKNELPKIQETFMREICFPCYESLVKIFPELTPILHQIRQNIHRWKNIPRD